MAEVLGSVLQPVSSERGPDALLRVSAPPDWLKAGERLQLEVPRLATCARCEGGGCDLCERRGAFTLREPDEPAEMVVLALSQDACGGMQIRVPELGAWGDEGQPRGQLVVRLSEGLEPSAGLTRELPAARPPRRVPLPWLLLPLLLVLMYVLVSALIGE